MLSTDQVPTEIEEIIDGSVNTNESLGLLQRFEPTHSTF